jgi:probable HAF family extracellular repeat protein
MDIRGRISCLPSRTESAKEKIVNKKSCLRIAVLRLGAALVVPVCTFAQSGAAANQTVAFHHYRLIEIPTLGGPNSYLSGPQQLVLNDKGTFAVYVNTATPNPNANCAIAFNANGGGGDCSVEHAALWHDGTLTDLKLLSGGANGQTSAIASSGLVAGFSEDGLLDASGMPVGRATLWTREGKVTDLGAVPGGTSSLAIALNNLGHVVGFSDNDIPDAFSMAGLANQTRAFLWRNGVIKDLGTLGGADALAAYVNEEGQVGGVSYTNSAFSMNCSAPLTTHAFFYEKGKMTDVGTLGGSCSYFGWMNNRGQITGYANTPDENGHAFIWDKEGGLKNLGELPGGVYSFGQWINEAGEVVGGSDAAGFFHATLWKNGAVIDLGTVYGETCSQANSINSRGQIVGFASADCNNEDHAFLAQNGAIVDVNTLVVGGSGVTALNAFDINDRGEIAGYGVLPNGDERAVLLIPCDGNHPDMGGCDYSMAEASSTSASVLAKPTRFSKANMMMRLRARVADRYRRF